MNNKITSYNDYKQATAWDKLAFVASAKYEDKHVVELKREVFGNHLIDDSLIVRNQLQFAEVR